ncbi:MAG: DUF4405 domain-containing protein [Anaerolineae bacterium]|nr:DUF4405 domain-containing protein [Anaerolineae bacterium]
MKRAKLNYWIDVLMGVAFVISAVSGLVLLLPLGFLSSDVTRTLGVSNSLWDLLHLWGSLAMITGVGGHLLLHTKWIVAMTKKLLVPRKRVGVRGATASAPGILSDTGATSSGRRRFLKLSGALLAASASMAGGATLLGLRIAFGEGDEETVAAGASNVSQNALKSHAPHAQADAVKAAEQPRAAETAPQDPAPEPAEVPALSDDGDVDAAPAAEPMSPPDTEPQTGAAENPCVACPRGLVNDLYPGRCRRYVDRDGDGICDLSVPQVCG